MLRSVGGWLSKISHIVGPYSTVEMIGDPHIENPGPHFPGMPHIVHNYHIFMTPVTEIHFIY